MSFLMFFFFLHILLKVNIGLFVAFKTLTCLHTKKNTTAIISLARKRHSLSFHNRVLPRTPPTPKGRQSPPSPPLLRTVSRAAHTTAGPMKANHQVFSVSSSSYEMSGEIDGRSRHATNSPDLSPEWGQSSPSLEEELFGPLNRSSSRLSQQCMSDENTNDKEEIFTEPLQFHDQFSIRDRQSESQFKGSSFHGFSKSVSSLEERKSSLKAVLPTPPTFSAPSHLSVSLAVTSTPLPSHSDSDLSYQPAPPTVRTGTVVGESARSRRRTVSPRPRLCVVDVTNLVEAHAGKGDSDIPCHATERVISLSSGSSSASSYTPPTSIDSVSASQPRPDGVIERDHRIRQRSANKFREMVLGCRNGE